MNRTRALSRLAGGLLTLSAAAGHAEDVTAQALVSGALDLMRGATSRVEFTMTIKRPDWERSTSVSSWSRGREDTLIRFTAPAKDAGNALLKVGDSMWTYTPKLNRTIRLPHSMRAQSWGGSDFSYNDLSRSDQLLRHYDLAIVEEKQVGEHLIYTIEAVPFENAPVVWGKELWVLRDDYVMLEQVFYDQLQVALKRMTTLEIGSMGGRTLATRMRMERLDEPDHWTEVVTDEAEFDIELPERMFTQFSLKSGGG